MQTRNIVQVDFSLRRWKGLASPGTRWHAHPLHCACPFLHVPFRCSGQLCCMSFQSRKPVCGGPSHTFHLERTAWAHIFVSFCCFACAHVCMSFHCHSRVHISEELPQDHFLGQDNAQECPYMCAFIPGATSQQRMS